MSDYILETGLCLMGFWMAVILTALITEGVWHGIWFLAVLYPPLLFLYVWGWRLWKDRPSVQRH